jgi:hypothetical protein
MYMHKSAGIQVKLTKQQLKRLNQLTLLTRGGPARHRAHEHLRRACRMLVVYSDTSISLARSLPNYIHLPRSLSLWLSRLLSRSLSLHLTLSRSVCTPPSASPLHLLSSVCLSPSLPPFLPASLPLHSPYSLSLDDSCVCMQVLYTSETILSHRHARCCYAAIIRQQLTSCVKWQARVSGQRPFWCAQGWRSLRGVPPLSRHLQVSFDLFLA